MLRSVAGRLFLSYLGIVAVGLLVAAITISGLFVRYENDVLRLRLQELSAPLLTAMQTGLRNGQQPREVIDTLSKTPAINPSLCSLHADRRSSTRMKSRKLQNECRIAIRGALTECQIKCS